jgi:hypothetical protein
LICSLLLGLFNPLFPGFTLLISFTRKEAPTSKVPHQ